MTSGDDVQQEPTRRLRRVVHRSALALGLLLGIAAAPAVGDALRDRSFDVAARADVRSEAHGAATVDGGPAAAPSVGATRGDAAGTSAVDLPEFTHRSAGLGDVSRVPQRIRVDALGVDAPVVPRGTDELGQLDVPPDGRTVVWYRAGSVPGAAGSAVLAAHVDHAGSPGVFFHLDRLRAGERVRVTLDDGTTRTFEVVRQRTYRKERLPIERLFTRNGDAVLTLITCGGQFNETTRHYDSNTVVQAVLR